MVCVDPGGDIESRFVGKRIQQVLQPLLHPQLTHAAAATQISGSRRGERKVFFIKPKPEKDPTAPPVPAKPRVLLAVSVCWMTFNVPQSAWFGAPNKLQLEAKAMLGIGIERCDWPSVTCHQFLFLSQALPLHSLHL